MTGWPIRRASPPRALDASSRAPCGGYSSPRKQIRRAPNHQPLETSNTRAAAATHWQTCLAGGEGEENDETGRALHSPLAVVTRRLLPTHTPASRMLPLPRVRVRHRGDRHRPTGSNEARPLEASSNSKSPAAGLQEVREAVSVALPL